MFCHSHSKKILLKLETVSKRSNRGWERVGVHLHECPIHGFQCAAKEVILEPAPDGSFPTIRQDETDTYCVNTLDNDAPAQCLVCFKQKIRKEGYKRCPKNTAWNMRTYCIERK